MRPLLAIACLLSLGGCSQKPLPVLGEVSPFQLTSQKAVPFDSRSLAGHVWVADFIFTNCEGPCPRMSSHMRSLQDRTAPAVQLVSFSVDPKRDTPAVLAKYAGHFQANSSRWSFLTGDPDLIETLNRNVFKLGTGMEHSTRLVLVDKKGRIRGYYGISDGDAVARVSKDAARLEKEAA